MNAPQGLEIYHLVFQSRLLTPVLANIVAGQSTSWGGFGSHGISHGAKLREGAILVKEE